MISRNTFIRAMFWGLAGGSLSLLGCSQPAPDSDDSAPEDESPVLAAVEEEESSDFDFVVDYGESETFEHEDIDAAIVEVMDEFKRWKGCEMKSIAFTDDDTCAKDLSYCNELRAEDTPDYDESLVLISTFHSPSEEESAGTAWEPDTDYTNYEWHLARTQKGAWTLLTWGY